jgi:hypothetical protein
VRHATRLWLLGRDFVDTVAPHYRQLQHRASFGLRKGRDYRVGNAWLIGVIAVIVVLGIVWVASTSRDTGPTRAENTAEASKDDGRQDTAKSPEQIKADELRVTKLKKDFVITTDEFNGIKTYRHRAFSKYMNGNGTTIEAEIREKDDHKGIYTESRFVSDDWIFHESYEVKAQGILPMASRGETQREVLSSGGICEVLSSTSGSSLLMAAAIKAAQDKHKPVRVRLEGKFYHDYTLPAASERAIAETYELYSLIASGT